jgi:uncharacterized protein YndB with AHSA1/START domain
MDTETPQLSISRVFDAPRELVYLAFTDPDHLAAWWGPAGSSVLRDSIEFDLHPGGFQRWTEVSATEPARRVDLRIDLADISRDELLEGVMRVSGELPDGIDPFASRFRIEFHDEVGRRTRLEIRQWLPEDMAAPSEGGWSEAFAKLDSVLASGQVVGAGTEA